MKRMFYDNSSSKLLMEIVLTYGELPYPSLKILRKDVYSLEHTARALLDRGYFTQEIVKSNNARVRVLLLSKDAPSDYIDRVYSGALMYYKKALQRKYHRQDMKAYLRVRTRSLNIAESAVFSISAGALAFPYEKKVGISGENKAVMKYYAPWEIKDTMLAEDARAANGRCTGYIQMGEENIAMYCMGTGKIKILHGIEHQMRDRVEWQMNNCFSNTKSKYCRIESAVITTPKYDISSLMIEKKQNTESIINSLKFIYPDVFYFPYTWSGARQMGWVISREKRARLIHLVLPNYCDTTTAIDCDGIYKGHYCLVFFIPDLCRLERFRYSAANANGTGMGYRIYCLDFQEAALREYLRGIAVSIAVVNFHKVNSLMEQEGGLN